MSDKETSPGNLQAGLDCLREQAAARFRTGKGKEPAHGARATWVRDGSAFDRFMQRYQPTHAEYVVMLLALAPRIVPGFLDGLVAAHLPEGGELPAFGGVRGSGHRGVLPTGETAQFLLAGDDLAKRLDVQRLFGSSHWFVTRQVLSLEPVAPSEPPMSGRLVLAPEVAELLTVGSASQLAPGAGFPAERLVTGMDWDDLVLDDETQRQIAEIHAWMAHKDTLLNKWGMGKRLKPGYRALFHGPPGTGKTLAATLLGKQMDRPVYRTDLSRLVSKFIGETEKNLSRLFDMAEHKGWILFFDEADALFGKRTDIRDSNDKYANQEVAYLLQRIEAYDGLVILATNRRGNIDEAFVRRFQSIVHFPMPGMAQREALWRKTFPCQLALEPGVDWPHIARQHELSGAAILNASSHCALQALASGRLGVGRDQLEAAILREYVKEGRVI